MSEEREFDTWRPTYPVTLHSEIVSECSKEWTNRRPWTHVRVLRKGVDSSDGASCHKDGCTKKVEAVQYTTAFGDPVFFCDDHAVVQEEWDHANYDSKPKVRPLPKGWQAEVDAMMAKLMKKSKKKEQKDDGEVEPS